MKPLPIPETEQLNAMLEGSVYNLVCTYMNNSSQFNLKKYLTISRQKLISFLVSNPEKAETYFQNQKINPSTHDVEKIWEEGREYFVASLDHGKPRSIRCYQSLPEAVAEHILVSYGMY